MVVLTLLALVFAAEPDCRPPTASTCERIKDSVTHSAVRQRQVSASAFGAAVVSAEVVDEERRVAVSKEEADEVNKLYLMCLGARRDGPGLEAWCSYDFGRNHEQAVQPEALSEVDEKILAAREAVASREAADASARELAFWEAVRECQEQDFAACNEVGMLYEAGRGVEQDVRRSAEFYRWACQGGQNGEACFNLANLHADGKGVERDPLLVAALRMRAAELGYEP